MKEDLSTFEETIKKFSDLELVIMQKDLRTFEEDKLYLDDVLKELGRRQKEI